MYNALSVITIYIRQCSDNVIPIVDSRFDSRSYSLWASYELLNRIQDRPLISPIDIMEDFIIEMTAYSRVGKDENRKNIFRIAADTAEYLISLVSCPEGE